MSPSIVTMDRLDETIVCWAGAAELPAALRPPPGTTTRAEGDADGLRRPADERALDDWERRHGFALPKALRAWLRLSDGFYPRGGPAVHPIGAIGPMVPFARVPGLLVQPESWFELGNPNESETICIDLAYRWPDGDAPIFASGDDQTGRPPRIIAPSFACWFLRLLREGGQPYWLEPGFADLGDPWREHRRRTPTPPLPDRLRSLLGRVDRPFPVSVDDSALATTLGVSRFDVEVMLRHLQHACPD